MKNNLIFFYGDNCEHCRLMEVVADKLKSDTGIELERLEVEKSDENLKYMESLDTETCGGVPFFVNTKTGKTLCGEVSYEELKAWAEDK